MVLLPEEAEMTLAELRQMAARQQHQIEAQQQLLVAKEQRLKFLKQQEARHHHFTELKVDPVHLQSLKEKVESQELKLKHLRALHGQVEQQKTNNGNLSAELESIRALFSEKEKELNVAVSKVEELTRQLDEIRATKNHKVPRVPPSMIKLEDLRRELMYQTKLTEQQNQYIFQQREVIAQKQHDMGQLDRKILELTQRLQRKRLMNQQLSNQIHSTSLARQYISSPSDSMYPTSNVATVEPMQRESLEPDHTQDDMSAKLSVSHQRELSEFSLKKSDPKYQTLPYNTKFSIKGKQNFDDLQSDEVSCSSDNSLDLNVVPSTVVPSPPPPPPPLPSSQKTSSGNNNSNNQNMFNFAPRPFGTNYANSNTFAVKTVKHQIHQVKSENAAPLQKGINSKSNSSETKTDVTDSSNRDSSFESKTPVSSHSGAYSMEGPADSKKVKDKCVSGKITTSKPVVPPKPTLPVKPIPPPRQTPMKERSSDDKNDISLALSVLQSKSSNKEKSAASDYKRRLLYYRCVSRHALKLTPAEATSPESELSTYFQKSLVPSETKMPEVKRKPLTVQLPIKPKPLTIRKTPGLEPPKLKVQQNSANTAYKRLVEPSFLSATFKSAINDPSSLDSVKPEGPTQERSQASEVRETSSGSSSDHISDHHQYPVISISGSNNSSETKFEDDPLDSLESTSSDNKDEQNTRSSQNGFKSAKHEDEDSNGSASPCDSLECVPIHNSSELLKTEVKNSDKDFPVHHSAAFRRMKGNLKTEGSVRSPRRVSFDPLALLLDAALEGELELVKKTAREVPNPSAANDEGITALHNAICAGHFDVVKFLVEFGCDVNAQDSDGWTPLHCAASCNNLPMVKFLVERGACIFATTLSDHETAAEKCEEEDEGFDSCSEYLYGLQENMGISNDGIVYAVYDYEGLNPDELSFKDGDSVKVLRNGDDQESEWWWSRLNDQEGYVPRNLLGLYPRISRKD